LDAGQVFSAVPDAPIFFQGDDPGGTYGVVSGGVLLSVAGGDGSPAAGHIMRQGDWFGFGSVAFQRERVITAVASEPATVFRLPLSKIKEISRLNPEADRYLNVARDLSEDLMCAVISDLLIRDTTRRLAAVLLRVSGAQSGIVPDDPRGISLTQTLLADFANTSLRSAARGLGHFAARGWITWGYGHVRVIDGFALALFTRGED
jgi:CRP-like cAMP-binding protein